MPEQARQVRYHAGVPVFGYRTTPEDPPVSVARFAAGVRPAHGQRHIHEFPVLIYLEGADVGAACLLAPGAVIDPELVTSTAAGCCVFFDPAEMGGDRWASWRSHPLLSPFLHGLPSGLLRLHVPAARQPVWTATIAALETELADRAEGYRQAALAHLTLLLVDVARLATDVVGDLRRSDETLLAEVFDVIERHYAEPVSLREVAAKVGMTPGHLTTVVRRRTGRTVLDWIIERRMAEARALLRDTDLAVGEIGRRVGQLDPGYFARVFRQVNGVSPREWRRRSAVGATGAGDR
jgi:AraC family transcriptional regulator, transcriptional activator of pobA